MLAELASIKFDESLLNDFRGVKMADTAKPPSIFLQLSVATAPPVLTVGSGVLHGWYLSSGRRTEGEGREACRGCTASVRLCL